MVRATFSIRVTYADTDQMKFVYYGNYAKFFEIGRVELFRSIDLPYKSLEVSGIMMPVLNLNVNYLKPALYDDMLKITTIIPKLPSSRILFEYKIENQNKVLLSTGTTSLVFISSQSKKPVRCPKVLLDKLSPYFK